MAHVLSVNERAFAGTRLFPRERLAAFNAAFRASLDRHAARLDARQRAGKVRRCHGDLHLRNICMFEGRPTLFDCIEFNEELATVDVLYDLAFLLMDLWHRDLRPLANVVFNRYLDARDETDGVPLVPFFMAVRAAVRAHIAATLAGAQAGEAARSCAAEAEAYFGLALDLLTPSGARIVAVGGRSGSGKSSLAAAIADRVGPPPGARIVSSDRTRKRLFGVDAETRLPAEAYRPEMSSRVYGRLFATAEATAALGQGVVADAVFDRAADRAAIAARAAAAGVPFAGLWLEAPEAVLVARVDARKADPSDATADIVRGQLARDPGAIGWHRLDAGRDLAATAAAAIDVLKEVRRA
jgi:predicted kinase